MTANDKLFAKIFGLPVAFIVVFGVLAGATSPRPVKTTTATTARVFHAIPTSAEDDLRTGDISIKNGVSAECARQGGNAPCLKAWSDELDQKLHNPQWRAIFERRLDAVVNR